MTRPKPGAREARERYEAEVRRLFAEGKTDEEMSATITASGRKVGVSGIRKYRCGLGLIRTGYRVPPTREDVMDHEYVLREYDERDPKTPEEIESVIRGIANDVGRSYDHVRRYLRNEGKVQRRKDLDPDALAHARVLLEDGMPYTEVSELVEISIDTLKSRLPGLGLRDKDRWAFAHARRMEKKLGLVA